VLIVHLHHQQQQQQQQQAKEHWIQRITFAAETNAADTHSVTA